MKDLDLIKYQNKSYLDDGFTPHILLGWQVSVSVLRRKKGIITD